MARPRKDETMQAVSLRLPASILEKVDACAARLRDETPLLEVTRTDALRYLLQVGLEQETRPRRKQRGA